MGRVRERPGADEELERLEEQKRRKLEESDKEQSGIEGQFDDAVEPPDIARPSESTASPIYPQQQQHHAAQSENSPTNIAGTQPQRQGQDTFDIILPTRNATGGNFEASARNMIMNGILSHRHTNWGKIPSQMIIGGESLPFATEYYQKASPQTENGCSNSPNRPSGTPNQYVTGGASMITDSNQYSSASLPLSQQTPLELAQRDRVLKADAGSSGPPSDGETNDKDAIKQSSDQTCSKQKTYNKVYWLLTLLLGNIRKKAEAKKLEELMDSIDEANSLILPAFIHPEPLRQAKVSPFMSTRMKIARVLLPEFDTKFSKTPGAMKLLTDRYGELPRYLW